MKDYDRLRSLLDLTDQYLEKLPEPPAALAPPTGAELAGWLDHTLLKPEATFSQIKQLCDEAAQHKFATVCVNPIYVQLCAGLLKHHPVGVCTVVGFPLGASLGTYKAFETLACLEAGATEIDMMISIGALKGEAYGQVLNEIEAVTVLAHNRRAKVKVILEVALLTQKEKIMGCLLSKAAGADFVKTSTGFGPGGATLDDVALLRRVVGAELGVKAADGVRSYSDALALIQAGASRLGSGAGVRIMHEVGQ